MTKGSVRLECPDQPAVRALLQENDAYYAALYPAESNHLIDLASLQSPEVAFFVARFEGEVGGYGACVDCGDYGEVKRLYVPERARGRGLAKLIMDCIERHARSRGFGSLRAETGVKQPEALSLYAKLGYRSIEPFGSYKPDPLSVFLEKALI